MGRPMGSKVSQYLHINRSCSYFSNMYNRAIHLVDCFVNTNRRERDE